MGKIVAWTDEMLDYIREHYPNKPAIDVADALGVVTTTVINKAKKLGIEKSPDFDKRKYFGRYTHKHLYK